MYKENKVHLFYLLFIQIFQFIVIIVFTIIATFTFVIA